MNTVRHSDSSVRGAKRGSRPYRPTPIGHVLDRLLEKRNLSGRVKDAHVFATFADIAGAKVREHAKATKLRQGELTVAVDSASWRQQLTFLIEPLREKLNATLGREVVKSFRLVHGERPTVDPLPVDLAPPPPARTPPSFADRTTADRLSHLVPDGELASIVARSYLNAKTSGR